MKKNRKGFTLIEILAAVTILGILSVVAIVSVNNVIQNAKEKHYTTAESQLKLAGQSYVQQNRSALPKAIGQKTKISLKILVEQNYIEQIKDYSDNNCDMDKSYVQIFKYSQDDYSYMSYLDCPSYDSKATIKEGSPTVSIEMTESKDTKTAKAKINITDNEKLLSWSYIIYRDGKEVKNSGSTMLPNYDQSLEKTLDLSKYTPGTIKVAVTATNIYGLTTTKTASQNYADTQKPECIIKDVDKNPKPWTKGPVTVTVGCDDKNGTGCTREEYTKTFKTSMANGTIKIKDNSGNEASCTVSVNIDLIKPTITVKAYKRTAAGKKEGNARTITANESNPNVTLDLSKVNTTKWLNNSTYPNGVYYEITYSDTHSNITYEAKENPSNLISTATNINTMTTIDSGTSTTNVKKTYSTTEDGHRIYILTLTDEVGNTSTATIIAPLDRVAPERPAISNPTNGNWTNQNFALTLTSQDNLSGIKSFQYTYKNNATTISTDSSAGWVEYANSSSEPNEIKRFTTPNFSRERNQNVYIRACDRAGNCSENNSTPIKIDKTGPKCTVSNGSATWINATSATQSRTITATCSDDGSGCKRETFSHTYSTDINTTKAGAAGNNNGGYFEDNVGNVTQCAADKTIKIDKTPPTCDVSGSDESWVNSNKTITATCSDGGSGCKEKSFSHTYSSNINITTAGAKGNNNGGTVQDNAGNTTNCEAKEVVRIDKTPPTCDVSGGNETWINASSTQTSTVKAECSDTGGSGCVTNEFSYEYTADINTTKAGAAGNNKGGTVQDKAGNKTDCDADRPVKIDKTAPSIPEITNPSGGNWKNAAFSLTLKSTDATSGIKEYQYTYKSGATSVTNNNTTGYVRYSNSNSTSFTTTPFSAERNQAVYVRACDNAGNCSSSSNTQIKIDTTPPTCSVSANSSGVSLTKNDTLSGVKQYGLNKSSSSYNSTASLALSSGTFYGIVQDYASNTRSCSITLASTTASCPSGYEPSGNSCRKFSYNNCSCGCCYYNNCTDVVETKYTTTTTWDCAVACSNACKWIRDDYDFKTDTLTSTVYDYKNYNYSCPSGYTSIGSGFCSN